MGMRLEWEKYWILALVYMHVHAHVLSNRKWGEIHRNMTLLPKTRWQYEAGILAVSGEA